MFKILNIFVNCTSSLRLTHFWGSSALKCRNRISLFFIEKSWGSSKDKCPHGVIACVIIGMKYTMYLSLRVSACDECRIYLLTASAPELRFWSFRLDWQMWRFWSFAHGNIISWERHYQFWSPPLTNYSLFHPWYDPSLPSYLLLSSSLASSPEVIIISIVERTDWRICHKTTY